jgi:hypothetical protein
MAEVPAQIIPDVWGGTRDGAAVVHAWLITAERILGRLADGPLAEWRWGDMIGCRVDLTTGTELLSIHLPDGSVTNWTGPGISPLAIVAIARLYGPCPCLITRDSPVSEWVSMLRPKPEHINVPTPERRIGPTT